MTTKKSTAKVVPIKKATPAKVVPIKKVPANKKVVAAVKKITPAEVKAVKKSVAKKKAPTAETNLKNLVVRMAYTYIPDVMAKTAAEVDNWKEFVEQIETYLEASLVNVLPKPEVKE